MKFDDILKELGEFGFYQKRLYLLLCIPAISVGCYMMMNIILLYTPEHRCKLPNYPNDTWEIQSEAHRALIANYIPPSSDWAYDRCNVYTDLNVVYNNISQPLNATKYKCTEWIYSQEVFKTTFSSEQNLVCDDALKTSHAQLIFYGGVLAGDLGFGLLADMIGRKKAFYISSILQVCAAVGVAWAPNFWIYALLEFCVGAACHGVFMSCCVLGLEVVGPSKRVWAGIIIHGFFTIGLIYLSGMAWLLQDWFLIQLSVAVPCVVYLLYWWMIPESPRWLLTMGEQEHAMRIINKMAVSNKVELPDKLFGDDTIERQRGGKLWQLFTSKVLFLRTMIIFFNWIIVSMCYYGVTMYAGNIGGNFYLNFFLLALVEFPAFINIPMLECMGRKWTHVVFMWLGGFACIGTIFTVVIGGSAWQPATLALALIGKLGPSGAFGIIYVFSLELYPTLLRNAGMGASSCVARFGGMAAPYVSKMGELIGGDFGKALPLAIFGGTSILAGILCFFLPETLGQKLPDTIAEAREFKGHQRKKTKEKTVIVPEEFDEIDKTKLSWQLATLALALIGKLGPSGAFEILFVFSLELYPTLLRNAGIGASSCAARFGGMAAPYISKMAELIGGDFGKALPLAIFGGTSILAGILCLFLPETLGAKLPDTIEEAREFKGHQREKTKEKTVIVPEELDEIDETKL